MLRFYNTLSGQIEPFYPIQEGMVKMYTCGPTVYNFAHIGNYRAYIFEDLLRRYLKYKGYRVLQVMNITDIDDKTIRGAQENGVNLRDFTDTYTNYFFEDLDALNIERAEFYPRATDHIDDMIDMVQKLIDDGYAYEEDGSIYYAISKFKGYGKLSKVNVDAMKTGIRYDTDEYDKEDIRDFVLWKKTKNNEHTYWDAAFGRGRPGWHIECSAMSRKYLGDHFDIHTGGVDNIFPHHENEIAQSEAYTNQKFVNYWLHCAHLKVKEKKMSKSLGNFYTPRDLYQMGISPTTLRYTLLSTHYRATLNFDIDELADQEKALSRLQGFYDMCHHTPPAPHPVTAVTEIIQGGQRDFESHMDNDLNISASIGAVFKTIRQLDPVIAQNGLHPKDRNTVTTFFHRINEVLGVVSEASRDDAKIWDLITQRETARKNKDYRLADTCRESLLALGVVVEDTPAGPRWKRIS